MSDSASELGANSSCTHHLGSLDVPDILDNMKQDTEGQDNLAVLSGNHLATGCLQRHANQSIAPCLYLKKRQSDGNSCSSPHTVAGLNNKTSIANFDQDPQIQAMESYLKSLLNAGKLLLLFNTGKVCWLLLCKTFNVRC